MNYFTKIEENPYQDLLWNIPEQAQDAVNVVGGNSQNFCTAVKISEYLAEKYPIKQLKTVLPDALKAKLPSLANFVFLSATESGSFADAKELEEMFDAADYNLLVGDLSKNRITAKAVAAACEHAEKPLLITRDAVDLAAEAGDERLLMNDNVIIMGSLMQLQKLLKSVYYPKMLLMSQSLVQVAEVLHKFTLSYPVSLVTLHNGQILVAKNSEVVAVPLEKSGYSPIMVWSGELAAKIVALNLYNPHNFMKATICALFS